MKYICVRTYGRGRHMNRVYPVLFDWLDEAEAQCDRLNEKEELNDKWIPMALLEEE